MLGGRVDSSAVVLARGCWAIDWVFEQLNGTIIPDICPNRLVKFGHLYRGDFQGWGANTVDSEHGFKQRARD